MDQSNKTILPFIGQSFNKTEAREFCQEYCPKKLQEQTCPKADKTYEICSTSVNKTCEDKGNYGNIILRVIKGQESLEQIL